MKNFLPRLVLALVALGDLAFAWGLFWQQEWATALWIWPTAPRLNHVFVSSIAAAIGAPVLWIAMSGTLGALRAGALNLVLTCAGCAYLLFSAPTFALDSRIRAYGYIFAAGGLVCVALYFYSRRFPLAGGKPVPPLLRWSFAAFFLVLVPVGLALVRGAPHVFPWPLKAIPSALYGWIFLGAAVYFAHGFLWPSWRNAYGQLWGFLAYDIVLLGPYTKHLATVLPEHRPSLLIYLAVITYSTALALYYLVLDGRTRFGRALVSRP